MKTPVSTVTTKGQLVIPSKLRRKYGIRKGTRVAMIEEETRIILQPLTREYIRRLRGSLEGENSALEVLKEGRKQDRANSLLSFSQGMCRATGSPPPAMKTPENR